MRIKSASKFKAISKVHREVLEIFKWYASHVVMEVDLSKQDDWDEFQDEVLNILLKKSDD